MSAHGLFLGLEHDLSEVMTRSIVSFWTGERFGKRVQDWIDSCRSSSRLILGTAFKFKLYGTLHFLEQGVYGRVGYGALQPLKVICWKPFKSSRPS